MSPALLRHPRFVSLDQHNAAVARYLQQLRRQRTQETPAQ